MATIKDIARISGYSIGTVSRVLNNKADVSEKARSVIESVIREQNYQPNDNAKRLKHPTPSGIYVIVRGMKNVFLVSILEEILFRMREHKESVSVQFLNETEDEIEAAMQMTAAYRPKGIMFLGGSTETFRGSFRDISVPCVLITADASAVGHPDLSSFTTDDRAAAEVAVTKLIEAGHTRIGILGGYPVSYPDDNSTLRLRGALDAMSKASVSFSEDKYYEPCAYSMQAGYEAAGILLDRCPDITGIFAVSDTVAFGAMRQISDRGLSVPDDISVVGFDGIENGMYSVPRLSTIRQDISELAARSVDDLLLRISYGRPAAHSVIPFSYLEGESVSSPRLS